MTTAKRDREQQEEHEEVRFSYSRLLYFRIFQYCSPLYRALFAFAFVCSTILGLLRPGVAILFGQIMGKLSETRQEEMLAQIKALQLPPYETEVAILKAKEHMMAEWEADMVQLCRRLAYFGFAGLVFGYIESVCINLAQSHLIFELSNKSFRSFLRQNIAWFDAQQSGQLQNRLTDDLEKVRMGTSERVVAMIRNLVTFLGGITVGYIYSWQLALVVSTLLPLIIASGAGLGYTIGLSQQLEQKAYAEASGIAAEAISANRTVAAFGRYHYHTDLYAHKLKATKKSGIKRNIVMGLSFGAIFLVTFGCFAIAFRYGPTLIEKGDLTTADMMTTLISILMGALAIGSAFPGVSDVIVAKVSAGFLHAVILRKPVIETHDPRLATPKKLEGNIEFSNVRFNYPTRPESQVLRGVSFRVNKGETVALVGHSGCGKSTCTKLLLRFYNTWGGRITLDGKDIREIDTRWLRENIGVVSQEPVLFGYSIAENIRLGKEDCTMEEVVEAAKAANAHAFIQQFPHKYDTQVGESGTQLSGGQKQRIAIARALIKNPPILLLDEATSALDTESEKIVQEALDRASEGRTTIVIAHRLSTIRNASKIIAFDDGLIAEVGTHDQLMQAEGLYYSLVLRQQLEAAAAQGEDDEPDETKDTVYSKRSGRHSVRSGTTTRTRTHSGDFHDYYMAPRNEEVQDIPSFLVLLKMNSPEWIFIMMGCLAALMVAGSFPVFAIFFGDIMGVLEEPEGEERDDDIIFWCCMFLVLGAVTSSGMVWMYGVLGISGERLTERTRNEVFDNILHQDTEFFDSPENSTGALTGKLATDAALIQGATGVQLKAFFEAISALIVGITIAFIFSWQLALLIVAFMPLTAFAMATQTKLANGTMRKGAGSQLERARLIQESISNIRTVQVLCLEESLATRYERLNEQDLRSARKVVFLFAIAPAIAYSMTFFLWASAYRLATYLMMEDKLTAEDSYKVIFALMFAVIMVGQCTAFLPDVNKAKRAAGNVLTQLEIQGPIHTDPRSVRSAEGIQGNIRFEHVRFSYPERRNTVVLRDLTLDIAAGQRVALVGFSGCGKSTLMQLLLRLYDPDRGEVMVDGVPIFQYDLKSIRGRMAIVSQEPTLFSGTIRENITYGATGEVPLDEIKKVAEMANAAEFVETFPDGYDTNISSATLSGGQKQRIAIARALVRNPKILLLDEATSALDTESEKIVQDALDKAQEGRTCVIIAHRLSTIQTADMIVVVENGRVAQTGSHQQLLANKSGIYYTLCQQQNLGN